MSRTSSLFDLINSLTDEALGERMSSNDTEWMDAWNETAPQKDKPAGSSGYVPVPDGAGHTAVIKSVTGQDNEKGLTILFNYYFPAQNTEETEYLNLRPQSKKMVLAKIYRLGLKPPKSGTLDALVAEFKKAVGFTVEVEKKSKKVGEKWYRDYFVQKVLDTTAAPVEQAATTIDDDIPF